MMQKDKYLISEISPSLTLAAEIVIELSIALKNCQIYGEKHSIVSKSIERSFLKIKDAFNLKFGLKFNFAKNTIIYEQNYLDKKNPIFSRFAFNLWGIGITSLEFKDGLTKEELLNFIVFLNEKKDSKSELIDKVSFPHIFIEYFTLSSIRVEKKEEISQEDKKKAEELWEEFLFAFSEQKELPTSEKSVSQSVVYLAKKLSEQAKEKEKDYGSAMIDYLKKMDSSFRRKGILSQTELGNKIKTFIETMDPTLRQQVLVSCLTTEELSPNILEELLKISNINLIMDALSKLNSESRAIPLTVYRTLTMLSMLEGEEILGGDESFDELASKEITEDRFQALLDALLSDDQRFEYTSEEYEEKIEKFQIYADEMAKKETHLSTKSLFSQASAYSHFLGISSELLDICKTDTNISESIAIKLNDIFTHFLNTKQYGGCLKIIALKKKAEFLDPKISALNYVWEEDDKINYFIDLIKSDDKTEAIISSKILSAIGKKAVGSLIEILKTSTKMNQRIHTLNSLIEMEDNPAFYLLELLNKPEPWYLQRNIVYIFKKRKDPSGIEKFKELWNYSHIKVKIEIIYYLYSIKNKEWINYFKEAISSPVEEMVLLAARMITKVRWDEPIQMVIERAQNIPPHKISSNYHKQLLHFLAKSGNKKALNFISCLPINVKTFFPWQKTNLKKYVFELLKEYKK